MSNDLKTNITSAIEAFAKISENADLHCAEDNEINRKAYFLERIAAELPIVLSEEEQIVGSMRTDRRDTNVNFATSVILWSIIPTYFREAFPKYVPM